MSDEEDSIFQTQFQTRSQSPPRSGDDDTASLMKSASRSKGMDPSSADLATASSRPGPRSHSNKFESSRSRDPSCDSERKVSARTSHTRGQSGSTRKATREREEPQPLYEGGNSDEEDGSTVGNSYLSKSQARSSSINASSSKYSDNENEKARNRRSHRELRQEDKYYDEKVGFDEDDSSTVISDLPRGRGSSGRQGCSRYGSTSDRQKKSWGIFQCGNLKTLVLLVITVAMVVDVVQHHNFDLQSIISGTYTREKNSIPGKDINSHENIERVLVGGGTAQFHKSIEQFKEHKHEHAHGEKAHKVHRSMLDEHTVDEASVDSRVGITVHTDFADAITAQGASMQRAEGSQDIDHAQQMSSISGQSGIMSGQQQQFLRGSNVQRGDQFGQSGMGDGQFTDAREQNGHQHPSMDGFTSRQPPLDGFTSQQPPMDGFTSQQPPVNEYHTQQQQQLEGFNTQIGMIDSHDLMNAQQPRQQAGMAVNVGVMNDEHQVGMGGDFMEGQQQHPPQYPMMREEYPSSHTETEGQFGQVGGEFGVMNEQPPMTEISGQFMQRLQMTEHSNSQMETMGQFGQEPQQGHTSQLGMIDEQRQQPQGLPGDWQQHPQVFPAVESNTLTTGGQFGQHHSPGGYSTEVVHQQEPMYPDQMVPSFGQQRTMGQFTQQGQFGLQ